MPIFVGSNSDDSRIRSNRVGFAVSTANPGSASEGDVYFNSSDSGLRTYDGSAWNAVGAGGGSFSGIASGTLANGQTVILHSDGKVGGISTSASEIPNFGSRVDVTSTSTYYHSTVYDPVNQKVVVAYSRNTQGIAVVGTVSGNTISFGSEVVFNNRATAYTSMAFDSSNEKIILAYRDIGVSNTYYGVAIVGTVSGNSISFGTAATFNSSGTTTEISVAFDTNLNKALIGYRDQGNSYYGRAIVGTVSGTSISFGSATTFNAGSTYNTSVVYDSTNQKMVIAYRDSGNSNNGTAIVGTISGTSVSFGSEVVFESAVTTNVHATYDSSNGKVVIVYRDQGNSNYGTAIVGTVSGTSISFGTAVVFESSSVLLPRATYIPTSQKIFIAYENQSNNELLTAIVGTVSGTSISFNSPATTVDDHIGIYNYISSAYDSTNDKVIIFYTKDNPYPASAIVGDPTPTVTNLTTENFLGFSDAAYSDDDTATIQIAGAVDDAQSGLTTGSLHYVQNDGTLSTTAGDPSVEAGTALSATKIKVKK